MLEDIAPFAERQEENLILLSEYSKAASEKWTWIVRKRTGKPLVEAAEVDPEEEESKKLLRKCRKKNKTKYIHVYVFICI